MKKINITITGAFGRMGKILIKKISKNKNLRLFSLTDLRSGKKINGIKLLVENEATNPNGNCFFYSIFNTLKKDKIFLSKCLNNKYLTLYDKINIMSNFLENLFITDEDIESIIIALRSYIANDFSQEDFEFYNENYVDSRFSDLNELKNEIINENMWMDEYLINILCNKYYNDYYGFYILKHKKSGYILISNTEWLNKNVNIFFKYIGDAHYESVYFKEIETDSNINIFEGEIEIEINEIPK